ncbi:MAG: S49 family peptidase [Candidatus Algichlamydia australiensis]|nr:S49 family peptidase [Chlamydiales bacterium]
MEIQRESIFMSGLRAFFRVCLGTFGLAIAVFILLILYGMFNSSQAVVENTRVHIAPDAEGNRMALASSVPVVLRVNINGAIGMQSTTAKNIKRQLLDSQGFSVKKGRVKAVFLHINSPGGDATQSDDIYRHIMAYKEQYQVPVYAFVDGLCASGAMYSACGADKIFSTPTSIIGSVGVLMGPNFNFYDLMEKYGVKEKTLTRGKDKVVLSSYEKWSPDETASLDPLITYLYDRFVAIVAKSRPRITESELKNEYGARIYDAPTAQKYGYIDVADSSYEGAMSELTKEAKIEGSYQVIQLVPDRPIFQDFIHTSASLFQQMKSLLQADSTPRAEYPMRR